MSVPEGSIVILQTEVGATSHGTSVKDGMDDRDEMQIVVPPTSHVIGLRQFSSCMYRTALDGERSQAGDLDLITHSLAKFCSMALKGNPSVLIPLFVHEDQIVCITTEGKMLRELVSCFISRKVAMPFLGYVEAQRQRMSGERGQKNVKRPELVEKYGYDTKYAGHMVRLGLQGVQLMETGKLEIPMIPVHQTVVLDVRLGRYTQNEVEKIARGLEDKIRELYEESWLPEEPDLERVEQYMIETYRKVWWEKEEKGR